MVGDQKTVRDALEARKIAAIILKRPNAPAEDVPLGKDLRKNLRNAIFWWSRKPRNRCSTSPAIVLAAKPSMQ